MWVLDADNIPVGVFNVTGEGNLGTPANYDALKQIFLDAAAR